MITRLRILVGGRVQGVGFRPFVSREATRLGLAGWVANTAAGVTIEAEGPPDRLAALAEALRAAAPPRALVAAIETAEIAPHGEAGFVIRPSTPGGGRTAEIPPDMAPCEACLAELFDPADRRFRYPFINCVDCGPRLSLIEAMPYDRARTSMRRFAMCRACQAEYGDPASRRFHAEPNACPQCGPALALWTAAGAVAAEGEAALGLAAAAIRRGEIVAVKGVGGFHLLADARSDAAVDRLRARKHRPEKPFAVMFPDLGSLLASCRLSGAERALVTGPERPIVLLPRRADGPIADAAAPANPLLGAMLPYAPLNHLLMRDLGFPVVATSGNLSEEPIATDEREAPARLGGVADLFLVHDRPIVRPVEDSVVRIVCGRPLLLRRARGYAPAALAVAGAAPGVLALGGHLKTTVALSCEGAVVVWPHIGDLETVQARSAHAAAAEDIGRLLAQRPRLVAGDLHPDYGSALAPEALAAPMLGVQHHLAHVVACMADNDVATPVLGVAWDGAGHGPDGTLWGGEFLRVDRDGWRRAAHLRPFCLPGGAAAMREPRRAALGLLHAAHGEAALAMEDLAPVAAFTAAERRTLGAMLARGVNAPVCTSVGRLFDAFGALAGLRQRASFEGQAAMELEWAAATAVEGRRYRFEVRSGEGGVLILDWGPALESVLADVRGGASPGEISTAFHAGLADAVVAVAVRVGERQVALTGGCFQNARLTEATVAALRSAGFAPLWHRQVPPNDGGLALGQAVWAGWREGARPAPAA